MTEDEWVAAAGRVLGMPYVWGGESAQEGGYDCTGLVHSVAGNLMRATHLPRESVAGLWERCKGLTQVKATEYDVVLVLNDQRGSGVPHHALLGLRSTDAGTLYLHASSGRMRVVLDDSIPGTLWVYRLFDVYGKYLAQEGDAGTSLSGGQRG